MSEPIHEASHNGPIKSPQQLLLAVLFSFVVPVFAIIGLVYFVTSGDKPSGAVDADVHVLGGVSTTDLNRGIEDRLRRVGMVEIRDANRPLKAGEEVYKAQCVACHGAGVAGAPKFGDLAAWAPRIKTGYESLLNAALKGKGAMGPQGGGDFEDVEIGRAVVYMTSSAGAKFAEPQRAATTAASGEGGQVAAGGAGTPVAAAAMAAAPATPSAATAAVTPVQPAAQPAAAGASAAISVAAAAAPGAGEALYKQACAACHVAAVAGAPKFGDKAAWAPRIALGIPALTQSVIKGKNAMPPRGGSQAGDAEIRAAVEYMVGAAK